jgi:dTMP kinase
MNKNPMIHNRAKNTHFLSFEGMEGSGKSTQIQEIEKYYDDQGFKCLVLREPGGTEFGEGLRSAILNSNSKLDPIAEAHLFASSRAQLLFEKIIPNLEIEKSVILLDRYIDSSFCYQGFARSLGFKVIEEIHSHYPLTIRPDKTFYLKIDYETSQKRQSTRGNDKDYFEKEHEEFYNLLAHGFDELAKKFSDRIVTIDATLPVKNITELLIKELK